MSYLRAILLCQLTSTLALWIPHDSTDEYQRWLLDSADTTLGRRDVAACGGVAGLVSCGSSFPSDFCCGNGQQCLLLNTSSSVIATLCCPAGQDCGVISPISCAQSYQNATANPAQGLHVEPPTSLETCGSACCPPGYACQNSNCVAQSNAIKSSASASITTSATTTTESTSSSGVSSTTTTIPTSDAAALSTATDPAESLSSHVEKKSFSSTAFIAGFMPGIVLGALFLAGVLLFIKKLRSTNRSAREKPHVPMRDTLTDLGPAQEDEHPTLHGRSISEPRANSRMDYRTDFNHLTPTRQRNADEQGPLGMPASLQRKSTPRLKGLWSHSPFVNQASTPVLTQSPMPNHLKRGTLSFHISPVRALRKQRSMHSLRRHVTDATARSNSSRQNKSGVSRNASTETIKVLMQTPDHPRLQHAYNTTTTPDPGMPATAKSWNSITSTSEDPTPIDDFDPVVPLHYPASSRYPSTQAYSPPQQQAYTPNRLGDGALGTPYTPSDYPRPLQSGHPTAPVAGLSVPSTYRNTANRDTTFTAMMERVGVRRSEFMGGNGHER